MQNVSNKISNDLCWLPLLDIRIIMHSPDLQSTNTTLTCDDSVIFAEFLGTSLTLYLSGSHMLPSLGIPWSHDTLHTGFTSLTGSLSLGERKQIVFCTRNLTSLILILIHSCITQCSQKIVDGSSDSRCDVDLDSPLFNVRSDQLESKIPDKLSRI